MKDESREQMDPVTPRVRPMKVALLSGIFPPDVGGPATHAIDLRDELNDRGHSVVVVSATDDNAQRTVDKALFTRKDPSLIRSFKTVVWMVRNRDSYEVIYATGLHLEAAVAAALLRRPLILKVVGDPVWERGRRLDLTQSDFETFRRIPVRGGRLRLLRSLRNWSLRRARTIVVPSVYLGEVVRDWLGSTEVDLQVIPNGVRIRDDSPVQGRRTQGDLITICVGRLVEHKRINRLIDAISETDQVRLVIVGEGPHQQRLESLAVEAGAAGRVRFTGALPHAEVMALLAEADVLLSASDYEGLPHVAIESLVCGTPVIAAASGGMREVIEEGRNGYALPDASPSTFARYLNRLVHEPDLLESLSRGAASSGDRWTFRRTADAIEDLLQRTSE